VTAADNIKVTLVPDTEMDETVGLDAAPLITKFEAVAELFSTTSDIVRIMAVEFVVAAEDTVGATESIKLNDGLTDN
jgi:hypothetical protein